MGQSNGALAHAGVAEIKRDSDTTATVESIAQVPGTEGASDGAGAIDRATDTVYVVTHGDKVIEYSLATGTPVISL